MFIRTKVTKQCLFIENTIKQINHKNDFNFPNNFTISLQTAKTMNVIE